MFKTNKRTLLMSVFIFFFVSMLFINYNTVYAAENDTYIKSDGFWYNLKTLGGDVHQKLSRLWGGPVNEIKYLRQRVENKREEMSKYKEQNDLDGYLRAANDRRNLEEKIFYIEAKNLHVVGSVEDFPKDYWAEGDDIAEINEGRKVNEQVTQLNKELSDAKKIGDTQKEKEKQDALRTIQNQQDEMKQFKELFRQNDTSDAERAVAGATDKEKLKILSTQAEKMDNAFLDEFFREGFKNVDTEVNKEYPSISSEMKEAKDAIETALKAIQESALPDWEKIKVARDLTSKAIGEMATKIDSSLKKPLIELQNTRKDVDDAFSDIANAKPDPNATTLGSVVPKLQKAVERTSLATIKPLETEAPTTQNKPIEQAPKTTTAVNNKPVPTPVKPELKKLPSTSNNSAPLVMNYYKQLNGNVSNFFNAAFTASGGVPPYHFQLGTAGGFPPQGIIVSPSGVISGTPSAVGTYIFNVCAVDATGSYACANTTMYVNPKIESAPEPELEPQPQNCRDCAAEDETCYQKWQGWLKDCRAESNSPAHYSDPNWYNENCYAKIPTWEGQCEDDEAACEKANPRGCPGSY